MTKLIDTINESSGNTCNEIANKNPWQILTIVHHKLTPISTH